MIAPGQAESLNLEPIKDGKVPKSRIADADKACQMVDTLVRANSKRAQADAAVKSQLDGNPPFDPAVLKKNGQAHRTNVSLREAEGIHNAAVTPYYDLFSEAPYCAEVQTELGREAERVAWSKIITLKFDQMLKRWDGFDYNIKLAISERTDFGKAFLMWRDVETWRAKVCKQSKVLVPDGTPSSIDELETLVIREQFTLSDLWSMVRNPQAAARAGWDRTAVLREMYYATPEGKIKERDSDFFEWAQQAIRNNDITESVRSNTVAAAHILQKEFSGKVSHLIVPEFATPQSVPGQPATPPTSPLPGAGYGRAKGWLFQRLGQYESFRQAVAGFFFDVGDGTWHSVKGLLVKLYPFVALKDRLNCATLDNAFLNMSLVLQPKGRVDLAAMQLVQIGPMTVIPPELTPVTNWSVAGRMEEGLAVEQRLDNKLSANIGQYRQSARREQGNPETATKVMADQSKEAMLTKGAINGFLSELDFFYEETFRRASNPKLRPDTDANREALRFQKACIDAGVPPEALTKIRSVRAYRNIGNGSVFMRQAAFRDMMNVVPMLNEEGRNNWLDDSIAAMTNQDMVARYNPRPAEMTSVADQTNLATLENAAMKTGVNPFVAPTQNHVVHSDIHLKAASDSASSISQGANPMEVLSFLEMVGPHVRQHLDQIANDPTRKRQSQALEQTWQKTAQFTNQLHQQVQRMQQEQANARQRQNGVLQDQELKQLQVQSDIRRKESKAVIDRKAKVDKANLGLEITAKKAQQDIAVKDLQTAHSIQRAKAEDEASEE